MEQVQTSQIVKSKPTDVGPQTALPKIRVPVGIKITLPYVVLALLLAVAGAYLVNRVVLDSIEERFTNQLIEAGKLTNDWLVKEEDRLLETLRLLSFTQGLAEAAVAGDAEQLRRMALPYAVNSQEEAIEILDTRAVSILSLRHIPGGRLEDYDATRGESIFKQWTFVQDVLAQRLNQGQDKHVGLAQTPWGDYFYVAGPLRDEENNLVGVVLVGKSLPTMVRQIRQDTLAHISIYDLNGQPIATTFDFLGGQTDSLNSELVSSILEHQDEASLIRPLGVVSIDYSEILGPWESRGFRSPFGLRGENNDLGLIGVAVAQTFLVRPSQITRLQIFLLTTLAFLVVIFLGVYIANRITRPLLRVVSASSEVAQGRLDVQVEAVGNDEVAILAHSFNQMVSGLREGSVYRDLLGRTVSPEVREELRRSFESGELRLEGQDAVATVLTCNVRGFTSLSEAEDPTTVLSWLNEYYGELVPIITAHQGVISKFEGDAILAFFGILPRPLLTQDSAYQACQTALAMLEAIEQINISRTERGEPPFTVGISLNTGPVTAGGLGTHDRLHYTIIGDTVNTSIHLESLTRQFGNKSGAIISQHTLFALRERRHDFTLESLGAHTIRGKVEQLLVYHLQPARSKT